MYYTELLRGVNAFASQGSYTGNNFPLTPHQERDMDGSFYLDIIDNIRNAGGNTQTIITNIVRFLRRWNRRVPINNSQLGTAISNIPQNFSNVHLQNFSLWQYKNQITQIFSQFAVAVKYTGASKVLHILNPDFFMMWDDKIRCGYGCYKNDEGYFNFLLRSQLEIQEVIQTYNQSSYKGQISQYIYQGRPRSILKLMDEYNFARYTKG